MGRGTGEKVLNTVIHSPELAGLIAEAEHLKSQLEDTRVVQIAGTVIHAFRKSLDSLTGDELSSASLIIKTEAQKLGITVNTNQVLCTEKVQHVSDIVASSSLFKATQNVVAEKQAVKGTVATVTPGSAAPETSKPAPVAPPPDTGTNPATPAQQYIRFGPHPLGWGHFSFQTRNLLHRTPCWYDVFQGVVTVKKKIVVGTIVAAVVAGSVGGAIAASSNTSHPTSATWAFTRANQHPDQLLESTYAGSHKTLDIAIYSLTKYDIVDAIVAAKKRGVSVRIITDKTEARNKYQAKELAYLAKYGIPIKENTHSGLMHMKVSIIDDNIVTTGSYNYSQSASTENDENLVVLNDPVMARAFDAEFQQMWKDTADYTDWK